MEGKGDPNGAIADYSKAIEIDPKNVAAYFDRGNAKRGKGDSDGAIADYSKAIEIDPKDVAAYFSRGSAKDAKRDLDGAIADYGKTIELDPEFANAYDSRGTARTKKGELGGAIADYSKAIEIAPKYAQAYSGRGCCRFCGADYAAAAADMLEALNLETGDTHATHVALWRYLSLQKGGKDGSSELAAFAKAHVTTNEWPAPVFRLYLGDTQLDAVLTAAANLDAKKDKEQKCEAYFYVGQWCLLKGKREEGVAYLKKCLAQDVPAILETQAAQAELERMGVK